MCACARQSDYPLTQRAACLITRYGSSNFLWSGRGAGVPGSVKISDFGLGGRTGANGTFLRATTYDSSEWPMHSYPAEVVDVREASAADRFAVAPHTTHPHTCILPTL